jgi:hypothetical protein
MRASVSRPKSSFVRRARQAPGNVRDVNNAEADNGTMRRVCRHRTPLGYGNWLGLPEVSVPAGYGADGWQNEPGRAF